MPLPRDHLLDELATAYVQAVAAVAGATIAVARLDYGVDGTLKQIVQAYWWTSSGTASMNRSSVRVKIPLANRLTGHAIADILQSSRIRFVT